MDFPKIICKRTVDEPTLIMTIKEYEAKLQELDPKFEIVQHPTNSELAGLYYDRSNAGNGGFLVTVPSGQIKEDYDGGYSDSTGHPHNYANKITFIAQEHLRRMAEEKGYKEDFYEPLDFSQTRRA